MSGVESRRDIRHSFAEEDDNYCPCQYCNKLYATSERGESGLAAAAVECGRLVNVLTFQALETGTLTHFHSIH
jgi:hypothetical protein